MLIGEPPEPFLTDVVMGAAGVVMAATWLGGDDAESVAHTGCDALLKAADRTPAGLDWGSWPGAPSRGPNYSHGTAGVASALAVAGAAYGRPELVDAAVQGARHLLAVGTLDDGGFIVPHTIPPAKREVEPITYTWCHGPTGTSHLFAALAHAGVTEVDGLAVHDLRRRCFRSVLDSGVPERLRPGFWDNDGRCCGTAGVGDVLLDGAGRDGRCRGGELLTAAQVMGDALLERSIRVDHRAFWRFIEYRQRPAPASARAPPGCRGLRGSRRSCGVWPCHRRRAGRPGHRSTRRVEGRPARLRCSTAPAGFLDGTSIDAALSECPDRLSPHRCQYGMA